MDKLKKEFLFLMTEKVVLSPMDSIEKIKEKEAEFNQLIEDLKKEKRMLFEDKKEALKKKAFNGNGYEFPFINSLNLSEVNKKALNTSLLKHDVRSWKDDELVITLKNIYLSHPRFNLSNFTIKEKELERAIIDYDPNLIEVRYSTINLSTGSLMFINNDLTSHTLLFEKLIKVAKGDESISTLYRDFNMIGRPTELELDEMMYFLEEYSVEDLKKEIVTANKCLVLKITPEIKQRVRDMSIYN